MNSSVFVYFVVSLSFSTVFCSAEDLVVKREKRDGLVAAATLTGTALGGSTTTTLSIHSGMIGNVVARTPDGHPTLPGGCEWFGSAPFCNGQCPPGYDFRRTAKKAPLLEAATFGGECTFGKKVFCCHADTTDCAWHGKWTSAKNGRNYYCTFEPQYFKNRHALRVQEGGFRLTTQNCGTLRCTSADISPASDKRIQIEGERCETLYGLFGEGTTTVGYCGLLKVNKGDYDILYKARLA